MKSKKKRRCPNFRSKLSEEQNKGHLIKSADVQISAQNQVKSKKKVITSADVQISAQNQMKSKKKGHRCPNRDPQVENHRFMTYRELLCSKTSNYPLEILIFPTSG